MKSFLAMFMVLIVSGDDEVIINGTVADRVLLPCLCPNRDLDEEFRWQMAQPNKIKVLVHRLNVSEYNDKYRNRAQIFQNEDKYNCSLLLTNITADDQGTYRCNFKHKNMYNISIVRLKVYANFSVCQKTTDQQNNSLSVKECEVVGRYRDAEILWYLDQQLLTNSTTTKIIHTYTSKADGDHTFTSKIITELTGKSEPICKVKAKGVSPVISFDLCHERVEEFRGNLSKNSLPRYFKLIPIGLAIGLSLILLYRWKHSQDLRRDRQVEPNLFLS